MIYKLARLFQLAALVILPVAIAGNLAPGDNEGHALSLKESLSLSAIGVLLFVIGWLLQQGSKPK